MTTTLDTKLASMPMLGLAHGPFWATPVRSGAGDAPAVPLPADEDPPAPAARLDVRA
jgi:hypothetical protein